MTRTKQSNLRRAVKRKRRKKIIDDFFRELRSPDNVHETTGTGACPTCGAAIHYPIMWHGVTPPPPRYTCNCNRYTTDVRITHGPGYMVDLPAGVTDMVSDNFDKLLK